MKAVSGPPAAAVRRRYFTGKECLPASYFTNPCIRRDPRPAHSHSESASPRRGNRTLSDNPKRAEGLRRAGHFRKPSPAPLATLECARARGRVAPDVVVVMAQCRQTFLAERKSPRKPPPRAGNFRSVFWLTIRLPVPQRPPAEMSRARHSNAPCSSETGWRVERYETLSKAVASGAGDLGVRRVARRAGRRFHMIGRCAFFRHRDDGRRSVRPSVSRAVVLLSCDFGTLENGRRYAPGGWGVYLWFLREMKERV